MHVTTHAPPRTATASAPGTCGELAQGVLPDGTPFHVTCPIDLHATAEVTIEPAAGTEVVGLTAGHWKTERALLHAAEFLELGPARITARLTSELDHAKGLASSSADLTAAIRALAAAHDATMRDTELAALAARIEPTDGVMYDGVVAADQHSGQLIRRWAWWPTFTIAMLRPAARRETGRRGARPLPAHARDYEDLLATLDDAARQLDARAFAEQATRSALLNESATSNPVARVVAPRLAALGAEGLCVGHSGTVCGVLFCGDDAEARAAGALEHLASLLPRDVRGSIVHTPLPPATARA